MFEASRTSAWKVAVVTSIGTIWGPCAPYASLQCHHSRFLFRRPRIAFERGSAGASGIVSLSRAREMCGAIRDHCQDLFNDFRLVFLQAERVRSIASFVHDRARKFFDLKRDNSWIGVGDFREPIPMSFLNPFRPILATDLESQFFRELAIGRSRDEIVEGSECDTLACNQ